MSIIDDEDFAIRAPYVQRILELESQRDKLLTALKNKTHDSNIGRGWRLSCGHSWPCNCSDSAAKALIAEIERDEKCHSQNKPQV